MADASFSTERMAEKGYVDCCNKPEGCTNVNPQCAHLRWKWRYRQYLRPYLPAVDANGRPVAGGQEAA